MPFPSLALSRPLKVAHVVPALDCGGLEHVVLHLVREGRNLGQEVLVICLERPGELACRAAELGATVECVEKPPGIRLESITRIRGALLRHKIDVVHTHQIGALFYAGPAARLAGISAVLHTEHGKHYAHSGRMRWLGRLAGRNARRFCCVSADVAAEVRDSWIVGAHKLCVVPNGIDTSRYTMPLDAFPSQLDELPQSLGIPSGAQVVGTVGRLSEVKRQDVLLRAFAALPHADPPPHLLLVGGGPLMADLRRLAEELAIASRVHFVGYQAAPEKFLRWMDAFALTSRSEGMPLVVLEAWAAGVPVVASRVGGLPEMIEDGRNGFLFPAGDHAAAAALLGRLLADQSLRQRVATESRKHVLQIGGTRAMAERYQREYLSLVATAYPSNS